MPRLHYVQQRFWPVLPEKLPRQKVYLYSFLIFLSTLLICFYYYPLETQSWTIRPVANLFKTVYTRERNSQKFDNDSTISAATNEIKNGTDLSEVNKSSKDKNGEPNSTTNIEEQIFRISKVESRSSIKSTNRMETQNGAQRNASNSGGTLRGDINKQPTTHQTFEATERSTISSSLQYPTDSTERLVKHSSSMNKTAASRNATLKGDIFQVPTEAAKIVGQTDRSGEAGVKSATDFPDSTGSGTEKGFLVFSENCKVPDLDPMHPSIMHLVSKTPPLDCSKDYKALTKSKGRYLLLNESAVREKTSGENYTCCYRTVQRENDGKSDDDVGVGKECIHISDKTKTVQEFIKVECKYRNGTEFYKEFHSFIHDKLEVERRCRHTKNKSQYSVLIIGADSMSRLNMHRQLNATADYLLKNMGAVEMFGFNKVGDNTFPNLMPLLTGYDARELKSVCWKSEKLPLDRCNFLWKNFSAKGYRTFYAEDAPHISSFNYLKEGFLHQPTDYYFRPFIKVYQDTLGREKHLNCYWCVGSISEAEAVIHWTSEFAENFSNRPYFAFSWINSLTHDFLNMGSAGDLMFKEFFCDLHTSGALKRTIVFFMGDHGMRWGEIRNTYIGRLEERLPMLLIALPPDFKQEHPNLTAHLQQNANRLVTPFDLHATLVHILNLNKNWVYRNEDGIDGELADNFTQRAISLFQPIPKERSCDDAFIEEHWCTCESSLEVDIKSKAVKHVADFIINQINRLLKPVSHKCAVLSPKRISDARLWQPPSQHKGHSAEDNIYTVVIHASPGGAVFEGTVKVSGPKEKTTLLGSISRLNLYGNQSICIDNAIFRKYCYCL